MKVIFPESNTILIYLENDHVNTKNNHYFKDMKLLDAMAEAFGRREVEDVSIKILVGRIFDQQKCFMPYEHLVKAIDSVSVALFDCAEDFQKTPV